MLKNDANDAIQAFIQRWLGVTASELATAQSFVLELCELLGVAPPHATPAQDYMFERPVTFVHGDGSTSPGRMDCYRRGHFVLEAKKLRSGIHTKGFDDGLLRARSQGEAYARALPAAEGRPPFVIVVDVGTVIELYSEFSRSGGTYIPFPDPRSHRIALADLARPDIQDRLRRVWTSPDSLNPARISAEVTRTVSEHLGQLARSLEQSGYATQQVAAFLTRCLFSMFAEDVALLPAGAFLGLLQTQRQHPATLQQMLRILWTDMDAGGFSAALVKTVLQFNGKLFKGASSDGYSLLLTPAQIDLLIAAAQKNWREVEPAIFGTLLERALNPTERHALGAHYTPRAYVERLVLPTVMEPLRAEWSNAQAAALLLAHEAAELEARPPAVKTKKDFSALDRHTAAVRAKWQEARQQVRDFHHRLCTLRVLDPACGSANFLYVTLEHLKRLEGEVQNQLDALGDSQDALDLGRETVTLQQLRGIELNERAAALAELVLWIGFLQWHIRSFGNSSVAEPVIHDYGNIEHRDAVLDYDSLEPMTDESGNLVLRWDGVTTKPHPATRQQVPDDNAMVAQWRYVNPRPAQWPKVDFIVGNPPFIGNKRMRDTLGDGYVEALRAAWPKVPESADFVMYWWQKAAETVRTGGALRFGLITTNSLTMIFNRRVIEAHQNAVPPLGLVFAIPDHPWVDSADGAGVRIAMTVGVKGPTEGMLLHSVKETEAEYGESDVSFSERLGHIHPDLKLGVNLTSAVKLEANSRISSMGMMRAGGGFVVSQEQAESMGLGKIADLTKRIRPFRNGKDLTDRPRGLWLIDLFGLSEDDVRKKYPHVYQWVWERVKSARDLNRRTRLREQWWTFGEPRQGLRAALKGLPRYIATVETAKHRTFQFLNAVIVPDHKLVVIASNDALHLGVLSSRLHTLWALASGGTLVHTPVYSKSRCFDPFPFPAEDTGLTRQLAERIRSLAEQLDAHRKARQAAHGSVTMTGMYNVLDKLRNGEPLNAAERSMNELGLVSVLQSLHDQLDAAVLQAYGWSDLSLPADTDALLLRLVELNTQRASEEATGLVRWLRPDFQRTAALGDQLAIEGTAEADAEGSMAAATLAGIAPKPWPSGLADQIKAVADVLANANSSLNLDGLAAHFHSRGRWRERLPTILDALVALGRVHRHGDDRWVDAGS